MAAEFSTFRQAVRDLVATASGVGLTIDAAVEGPSETDCVAVFPGGSQTREDNAQFRLRSVVARVILGRDPQVGPLDPDPIDVMEEIEEAVIAALTPFVAGTRVVSCDTAFDPSLAQIEFTIVGEFENPNEV